MYPIEDPTWGRDFREFGLSGPWAGERSGPTQGREVLYLVCLEPNTQEREREREMNNVSQRRAREAGQG